MMEDYAIMTSYSEDGSDQYADQRNTLQQQDQKEDDELFDRILKDVFDKDTGTFHLHHADPCNFDPVSGLVSPHHKLSEDQDRMADVLLSLKHAIVHQGQPSNCVFDQSNSGPHYTGQSISYSPADSSTDVSCSYYSQPPQAPGYNVCNSGTQLPYHQQRQQQQQQRQKYPAINVTQYVNEDTAMHPPMVPPPPPPPQQGSGNMFHAMSLNVSMNMTMGISPQEPGEPNCWSASSMMPPGVNVSPQYNMQQCSPHYASSRQPTTNYASSKGYTIMAEIRASEEPVPYFSVGERDQDDEFRGHALSSQRPPEECIRNHMTQIQDFSKVNFCKVCGKTYARPSTLKTHLRTHSGEKPYQCDTCRKAFSQAANLTAHLRTHSGEKPFSCPVCERRFSQSSSVTTHMRTHSGERPYQCRLCNKAFSDSSTLTKHMRIHSGEKPYQCNLCLLRFSQSGNLNRHMRIHAM